MNMELADVLRCPNDHEEESLVVMTTVVDGSEVREGLLGCPRCREEFPIREGIPEFGGETNLAGGSEPEIELEAEAVQALLGLTSGGGHVLLAGSVGRMGTQLAELLDGVGVVGWNSPSSENAGVNFSFVRSAHEVWPFKSSMFRGVVVGPEWNDGPNISEATRVLLKGQRVVVLGGGNVAGEVEWIVSDPTAQVGVKR
ncbi:MAG: hypothetical protein OEZ54_05045 [Gemmatimonadota bacterium]|nr:hypothetical protein [Gemmatimonadota bacterium]